MPPELNVSLCPEKFESVLHIYNLFHHDPFILIIIIFLSTPVSTNYAFLVKLSGKSFYAVSVDVGPKRKIPSGIRTSVVEAEASHFVEFGVPSHR
jgi:hypothetical protein